MKITQLIKELQELYEANKNKDLEVVLFNADNTKYAFQILDDEWSFGWGDDGYCIDIKTIEE